MMHEKETRCSGDLAIERGNGLGETDSLESTGNDYSTAEYLREKYGATMTTAQAADVLHCHPSHVRAQCSNGELPAFLNGKRWLIRTTTLGRMIDGEVA